MKINGVDIILYHAVQHAVSMNYSDLSNTSEWTAGELTPLMLDSKIGFKEIKVEVIVGGSTRDEIWRNGSNLIAALLSPCVVNLDGFEHNYMVYLKNADQAEQSIKRWHKATLTLCGYEYANQKSVVSANRTFIVYCNANLKTPAILDVVAPIGLVSVVIYGLTKNRLTGEELPITISGLTKDVPIIIDGETGLILENDQNKAGDVVLYDLPFLMPGKNEIVTDHDDVTITIKFKERYI